MRRVGKKSGVFLATLLAAGLLTVEPAISGGDTDETDNGQKSVDTVSRYHYDDIDRFFLSYDRFLQTGEESAFQTYLDEGTTGLGDFQDQFALTPEYLASTVRTYPEFFGSLRNLDSELRAQEPVLDAMFGELESLLPNYPMPTVYFLVGGLRAGGQAGDGNHVMVAAEIYAKTPGTNMSELKPGMRMYTPRDVVQIVAHEAAHIIQEEIQGTERYLSLYTEPDKGTLIAYSLREGAANLVAKLVSGGHINPEAEAYGLQHEEELWELFREQAMDTDLGDWFFYAPKEHPDWPRDLGYWMGYRMALKCYENAADKTEMLTRILDAVDPEALLRECALHGTEKN